MGTYTEFTLIIVAPEAPRPECPTTAQMISYLRNESDEAHYALTRYGRPEQSEKWYDHEDDLRAFSSLYPEYLFQLDGLVEEGTRWRKYFKNGKMQDAQPEIIYPPFDESKLT